MPRTFRAQQPTQQQQQQQQQQQEAQVQQPLSHPSSVTVGRRRCLQQPRQHHQRCQHCLGRWGCWWRGQLLPALLLVGLRTLAAVW
jgi:hypothetical protein